VREFINSLKDQYENLIDRAQEKMRHPLRYRSFFQEIKEYLNDLLNESSNILQSLPPYLDYEKLSSKDLVDINAQYRSIKHYLTELYDELCEFENLLHFRREIDFARYVTKYKKDLGNLIAYFDIKINGQLCARIYELKS
jgi:hypothetical protein